MTGTAGAVRGAKAPSIVEILQEAVDSFRGGDSCSDVERTMRSLPKAFDPAFADDGALHQVIGELMVQGLGGECSGVPAALMTVWAEAEDRGVLVEQYIDELHSALTLARLAPRKQCGDLAGRRSRSFPERREDVATNVSPAAPPRPTLKFRTEQAVLDLQARNAAKEIVGAENAAKQFQPPRSEGISTLLAEEPKEPSFHIESMWPHGGMVLALAPKKWGKSTLVRNVVRAGVTGEPFLGRFDVVSRFNRALVIDMELTRRQFYDYWRGVGLTDEQAVAWRLRGSSSTMAIQSPYVRRELVHRMRDTGADLMVLDPIGPALRACGVEENSNDGVGRFLDLLDEMRLEAGIEALLIPHHMGHNGEHGRGASVLGDKADAIWTGTFERGGDTSGTRFLGAQGRDVSFESTELAYDAATRHLWIPELGRSRASIARDSKAKRRERELSERTEMVASALRDVHEGFHSNEALKRHLSVSWNGDVLSKIRSRLVEEGRMAAGSGWSPPPSRSGDGSSS